ncbi:hypothetical protein FQZ97_1013720 [compost metagenome]
MLEEAADGEFDSGKRRPQVVRHGTEDGGAHGVAFREPEDLPAAGSQLLAFQLGGQVHPERAEQPSVAGRKGPAGENQPGCGVDLFDVVGSIRSAGRECAGFCNGPPDGSAGRSCVRVAGGCVEGCAAYLEDVQGLFE